MTDSRLFVFSLNPEPWEVGPAGVSRKGGKLRAFIGPSLQLQAYQEAVREQFGEPNRVPWEWVQLEAWFWRDTSDGGKPADATNLFKALEDALQGYLYVNDRQVRKGISEIVDQGPGVDSRVVVRAQPYAFDWNDLPW